MADPCLNMNVKWLKCVIKQNLQDQFLRKWCSDMNNSSKGRVYRIFQQNFGMEHYLKTLSPKNKNIFVKSSLTSGNWEMAWEVYK